MALQFGQKDEVGPSSRPEYTRQLNNTVETILKTYWKERPKKNDPVKALEEFWQSKFAQQGRTESISELVTFEFEPGDRPPYVSYVTLAGGNCFGSFDYCRTKADARSSAAKIALMYSVLNEDPSSCITSDYIHENVKEAGEIEKKLNSNKSTFPPAIRSSSQVIQAYEFMLTSMEGKSLLEFQNLMSIFQLLNWNGDLKILRDKGLSRQHVLSCYKSRMIDANKKMASDWVSREQSQPEIVAECYEQACKELETFRLKGRELRYVKEKKEILRLALQQLGEA